MSLFQLDALIGEGTRGVVRRVGNQPITSGGGTRRKGAAPGANAGAMLNGSPEVMVKVSGFGRGQGVRGALEYVARDGKLDLEKPDGTKVRGKDEIRELAAEWKQGDRKKHPKQRETMNLVLSMPPGTDPQKVLQAARAFGQAEFARKRDYVLVQHTDEKHPHVHLIVKMAGYDGQRLNPRKADLQHWRESFAEQLRELSVEAAATPRRARGVAKKPQDQELIHMRKRGKQPEVDTAEIKDALKQLAGQGGPRPWERAIRERHEKIQGIYRLGIDSLMANPHPSTQGLGEALQRFVSAMPPPVTRREELLKRMSAELEKGRQDRGPEPERGRS